jgi:chaperonin GroES
MSFNPTFDRVVIQLDEPTKMTPGGIVLPDKAQEKVSTGTVKAVGPGRWGVDGKRIPVSVTVGNRVMFVRYDGTEFETDETVPRRMCVLSEGSILGVLS